MSEQSVRIIRKLTFKKYYRYCWHTGLIFGKERCVGVDASPVWRLFRHYLWRIEIKLIRYEELGIPVVQSDGSFFELYKRGDVARLGKPE